MENEPKDPKDRELSLAGAAAAGTAGVGLASATSYGIGKYMQREGRVTGLVEKLGKAAAALEPGKEDLLQAVKNATGEDGIRNALNAAKQGLGEQLNNPVGADGAAIQKSIEALNPIVKIGDKLDAAKSFRDNWSNSKGYVERLGLAVQKRPLLAFAGLAASTLCAVKAIQYFGRDTQTEISNPGASEVKSH